MKKKKFSFMALLLALVLVVSACSGSTGTEKKDDDNAAQEEKGPKVLNLNNTSEPGSLHPALAQGTHESWILEHSFEGLTSKDEKGNIIPGVAEKWEPSEDGLTWTFTLKDDVKWSNGDPVTAHDFEYAWKYALAPETAAYYAYQLYYLAGGEEYNSGKGSADDVGVKATDDTTLVVTLVNPTPYFLDLTSFYTYYPVNKAVQEANPDWAKSADNYVSNGAFVMTEWKNKESIKLEKNENYYDADKVKLDEVNLVMIDDDTTAYQMYQTGELDLLYPITPDVQGTLVGSDNPEFQIAPDLSVYYYNLNSDVKPFSNAKVRKALSMAIDRQSLVDNVSQGGQTPAFGVIPAGINDVSGDFNANSGTLFEENVEEAKKLLAEGLAEEGMSSLPEFSILFNTNDAHKAIAEAIQAMWKENLAVDVTLENVEFQVKLDREKAGDYQISRAGWVGDYVDPMTFLDLWVTDGPYNDARYSNTEYDALIDAAKKEMDPAKRSEQMHKAEEVLINDMPIIPIYFYTKPFLTKEYVSGIYTPINSYPQFKYADVKK